MLRSKQSQNKRVAAQTKMERSMLNITCKDRRTNICIRERTCPRFETASVGFEPRTSRLRDMYVLTHSATAPFTTGVTSQCGHTCRRRRMSISTRCLLSLRFHPWHQSIITSSPSISIPVSLMLPLCPSDSFSLHL